MAIAEEQLTLVQWAIGARVLPHPTIRIGEDRAKVVLIALATYANTETRVAFPSARRLADDINLPASTGRRVVRDALSVLESSSLIRRVDAPTNSVAWELLAGIPANNRNADPAGIPANQDGSRVAGRVAGDVAGRVAGDVAGRVAGDVAGMPAPNKNMNLNQNKTPPSPPPLVERNAEHFRDPAKMLCADGKHRMLPDGSCMLCSVRPWELAPANEGNRF